jgi:hypothetical protein
MPKPTRRPRSGQPVFSGFIPSVFSDSKIQFSVKNGTKLILRGLAFKPHKEGSKEALNKGLGVKLKKVSCYFRAKNERRLMLDMLSAFLNR